MEWLIFTIGCIVILWLFSRWRIRNIVKLINEVPSNRLHSILGFGSVVTSSAVLKYVNDYGDKYGSNSILWNGPFPFFLTSEPESIKDVLNSKQSLNKPSLLYNGVEKALQTGIITINEPYWSVHRKLFNKAFRYKNLISFIPIFNETSNNMVKQMNTITSNSKELDMLTLFCELTINNSLQTNLKRDLTLTRYDLNYFANGLNSVLQMMAELTSNRIWYIGIFRKLAELTIFKEGIKLRNEMRELFLESVEIAKAQNTQDPSYLPDVKATIEYALEGINQNILNMQEVESEMLNIFSAAFETTSNTLYIVVVLLAMYPEIQERAYQEITSVVPDSEMNCLTLEHIDKMLYLCMIINESMRIFPLVPIIARKVTDGDLNLTNGITLPKGQIILISIFSLHRNKTIWGLNADEFNPDNFLPANVNSRHPYSFIPFAKGIRNCIGAKYALINLKITLAKVLRAYKFNTDFKFENLVPEFNITLRFAEQPKLHVKRR